MTIREYTEYTGAYCNRCPYGTASIDFPENIRTGWGANATARRKFLADNGWQTWSGRSLRHYCPSCVAAGYPRSGSMTDVTH